MTKVLTNNSSIANTADSNDDSAINGRNNHMHSKKQKLLFAALIASALLLSACTPRHGNLVGVTGNGLNTSYSLQDRRAAKSHIKIAQTLPQGAKKIGDFEVQRCHQYAQHEAPSDATLTDDLILLAYGQGADGIYNLRFDRESGLFKNCWHIAKGLASFYKNSN